MIHLKSDRESFLPATHLPNVTVALLAGRGCLELWCRAARHKALLVVSCPLAET
jgi:hypothetical protein